MHQIETQNLSPSQVHQLTVQASKEGQTIAQYLTRAETLKQQFCRNLKDAHELIDDGDCEKARKLIMDTVAFTYNAHSSVRTASNTQWLFNMYVEATGRTSKARSLFYPHLLTAEDLITLEEQSHADAIAYEQAQQAERKKRNGKRKVKEAV